MGFQRIASCVEVVLKAERSGEERRNVIHYEYTTVVGLEDNMVLLAEELRDDLLSAQAIITCGGTTWNAIQVTNVDVENSLQIELPVNVSGTAGGGVLTGNAAHCLTKRSNLTGRSKRGRFYLFDLPEAYANGDDVEFVMIPWINGVANALTANRVGGIFKPVIGSRLLHAGTEYHSISYDFIMDSQYRRLKKRGR